MQNISSDVPVFEAKEKLPRLNVNKLQAVLCMVASAAVSIGLIVWGIKAVL